MKPLVGLKATESRLFGLHHLYRYGTAVDTHDVLKVIAIGAMLVDHTGFYFFADTVELRIIGRIAAPLFFFLVGYSKQYRFKWDIFLCGVVLTLVDTTHKIYLLNILINFSIIKLFLQHVRIETYSNKKLFFLCCILFLFIPLSSAILEYGTLGFLLAMAGLFAAKKDNRYFLFLLFVIFSYFLEENIVFEFFESRIYLLEFTFICFLIFNILFFYRERIWALPVGVKIPSLIISRYSLWIYTAHVLLISI